MRLDPAVRLEVANGIAAAENRISKLRIHIERLSEEGSDATHARQLLELTRSNLGQLYSRQIGLRRAAWTMEACTR